MHTAIINVNQTSVKKAIRHYLRIKQRDPDFIKQFELGYCAGISSLWVYSKWLQTQATSGNISRNDYEWFKTTIELMVNWDGQPASLDMVVRKDPITGRNITLAQEFEEFISLIQLFQEPSEYLPAFFQGDLDRIMEDVHIEDSTTQIRHPQYEELLESSFTRDQLKQFLEREPSIINDHEMIYIGANNHATSLFKDGDNYYYFDPNYPRGEQVFRTIDELVEEIFKAYTFNHPIGELEIEFKIFSMGKKNVQTSRFNQEDLLKNTVVSSPLALAEHEIIRGDAQRIKSLFAQDVNTFSSVESKYVDAAFMTAVRRNDSAKIRVFLEKADRINLTDDAVRKAFYDAVSHGEGIDNIEVVKLLLQFSKLDKYAILVAFAKAAAANNVDMVKTLLEKVADSNLFTEDTLKCYCVIALKRAIDNENYEMMRFLLTKTNELGSSRVLLPANKVFSLAVKSGKAEVVNFLLCDSSSKHMFSGNSQDVFYNALMQAANEKHFDVINILLNSNKVPLEVIRDFGKRCPQDSILAYLNELKMRKEQATSNSKKIQEAIDVVTNGHGDVDKLIRALKENTLKNTAAIPWYKKRKEQPSTEKEQLKMSKTQD
jgi:ankyrin repeat protein